MNGLELTTVAALSMLAVWLVVRRRKKVGRVSVTLNASSDRFIEAMDCVTAKVNRFAKRTKRDGT